VQSVAWRPGGKGAFATGGFDRRVMLFDTRGKQIREFCGKNCAEQHAHSQSVLAVEFASGDMLVTAGVDRSVRVWQASSGKLIRTFENHTAAVRDLAVRPGESPLPMLASAGADRTVRFWQPTIGRMVRFARLPHAPLAIVWAPAGDVLLAACEDGKVRQIDPETAAITATMPAFEGWAYSIAVHRRTVACGSRAGVKRLERP